METISLEFKHGTLIVKGINKDDPLIAPMAIWDARIRAYRAQASAYASIILALHEQKRRYHDEARDYCELKTKMRLKREPRPYQKEALKAWHQQKGRGVISLPTGSGKSYLAMMAINLKQRSTLVVAPTLDLVRQWYDLLRLHFDEDVGVIGGGEYDVKKLTVTTYDSAYLHMEHIGNRFGLVIFDECHHLPGESFTFAAEACLAPFRMGLSATVERADGRHSLLEQLIGPIVYRQNIVDLSGEYLAEYDTMRIVLELTPDERIEYDHARQTYLSFIRRHRINMGSPKGWSEFIMRASSSKEGQSALKAHRRSKELAFRASAKLSAVENLLHQHRNDRVLLFTQDNRTALQISKEFLVPSITHQTKVTERSEILEGLKEGRYGAIVTSKVLNEGVDVPEANIAIVVSGSGSVREHVQRLGRILRRTNDSKRALLYELITKDTTETYTSRSRRSHAAYKK